MLDLDPGGALGRGAGGEFGIENADFAPESDAGKGHRLRNAEIAPGRGLLSGWRVAVGLGSGKIDPVRPSGEAFGLRIGNLDSAELALTGRFQGEEVLLPLEPGGISAQAAVSGEHPVTGDDQGYGIVPDCTADGSC